MKKTKHLVSNVGVLNTLKLYVPFGLPKRRKMAGFPAPSQNKNENGKGKAKKGEKGKSKSANFTCIETQSSDENNEGREVNIATRQVNLPGY